MHDFINIIIIPWQPCWPQPISVTVFLLSKALVPLWPLHPCQCYSCSGWATFLSNHHPDTATHWECAGGQTVQSPCQSPLPRAVRVADASHPEQRHWKHSAKCTSSLADSCAKTRQTQCTSAPPVGALPFTPFCDWGSSLPRGHSKPSQDLCFASLFLYTEVVWLCSALVNFTFWWQYLSCLLTQVQ